MVTLSGSVPLSPLAMKEAYVRSGEIWRARSSAGERVDERTPEPPRGAPTREWEARRCLRDELVDDSDPEVFREIAREIVRGNGNDWEAPRGTSLANIRAVCEARTNV